MTAEIAAPKPEPDAKAKKERFWSIKKKTPAPKLRKPGARSLSQPSCSRSNMIFWLPAAKDNGITQPAAAARILDAAITVRSAETDLQSTIELRARCQKLKLQNPSPMPKRKKNDFEALKKKTPAPKLRKSGARSLSQPSCSRSNTIHDSQLQKTMVLRSQPQQPGSLMQPLQCDLQRLTCKAQ